MSDTPEPVSHDTMSSDNEKVGVYWRYNTFRATDHYGPHRDVVEQVWATRFCVYRKDPRTSGYLAGSRDVGKLYKTESDAWKACIAEVESIHEKRMAKLRKLAEESV